MGKRIEGASSPTSATPSTPADNTATVQKDETFSQVAQRLNVSEQALRDANPRIDPNRIQHGQELAIPPGTRAGTTVPPPSSPQAEATKRAEGRDARVVEHVIEGQARQVQVESRLRSSAAPTAPASPAAGGPTPAPSTPTPPSPAGTSGPAPPATTGTGATAAGPASYVEHTALQQGSHGSDVRNLQEQLNDWRTQQGQRRIGVDGDYQDQTRRAVRDFQRDTGLQADGVAGPRTRDRLDLETDANFSSLSPQTQQQVRDLMARNSTQDARHPADTPENQAARTNLTNIATDPNFRRLSQEGQNQALQRFSTNPPDAANAQNIRENVRDRANLENSPNFRNLNADTRQQVLGQMDNYRNNQAARTNLMGIANDPNFSRLSRTHQEQTLNAFARNPGDAAYTQNLRNLTGSDRFRNLDDATKTRVINMAGASSGNQTYIQSLDRLVRHERFGAMSARDQDMTLNVFHGTTDRGREALQNLMSRDVGGRSALLSRGYGNTGTLLEQLNRASTTNLDSRLTGTNRAQVTEQLLQEVSDPNHYIDQSNRGTCTVTSMTRRLAADNPAEYARIVTDLSTTGRSRLANGDTIQPPSDAWAPDSSTRSPGERLIQSALMNYGNPSGYRNTTDTFPRGGMGDEEQVRTLQALHGRNFEAYTGSMNFRDDRRDILDRTREELRAGRGPVHTWVRWGPGAAHQVEVTEIRDGRVYFRNPWGGDQPGINTDVGPNGTTLADPAVRTEDARNAIQSMTEEEYLRNINSIIVPR